MKRHILCLGDSNTHGRCADPLDCADGGVRFNEDERWPCLLQKAMGDDYLVTEEGLSGRTTVFSDPLEEGMDALTVIYSLLKSHEVNAEQCELNAIDGMHLTKRGHAQLAKLLAEVVPNLLP